MFNVVAQALEAEGAQDPSGKTYQMSARMSVQYNEYKKKLNNEAGDSKKLKVWPTLKKLQVRICNS